MDEVFELLASIPEKNFVPGQARLKLNQVIKSLQQCETHLLEPDNEVLQCIETLCASNNQNKSECQPIICSENRSQVDKAIATLKKLFSENKFCLRSLLDALLRYKKPLSLQLLLQLQNSDIMQLTSYLLKYTEKYEDTSWFTNSLAWLVKDDANKHSPIITPVLSTLLATREPGSLTCGQDLASLGSTLTDQFCDKVVEWVLNLAENESSTNNLNYLSKLAGCGYLSKSALRTFAFAHLNSLTSTNFRNQILPLYEIPTLQNKKWKLSLAPWPLKSLLLEVVTVLGPDEILRYILSFLGKSQINWRVILLLTSSVVYTESGGEKIMTFIDQLLRRGLECDCQLDLGASIILARQCCQESASEFGTYSSWFGAHFGLGAASARSADQFRSLLELLIALVPAEPPSMLRVHLNAVPKAPTSCHGLLRDYTELARARLDDLNEPAEMEGLFIDSFDGEQDTRSQDVNRVLQHFLKAEKVLKVVLEAAVFRRKYFEGVFLVELLQLPGWSRQQLPVEVSGARHGFIEKLKSLDKIPQKLYAAYKRNDENTERGKFEQQTTKHQPLQPETDSGQKNKRRLQIKKKRES